MIEQLGTNGDDVLDGSSASEVFKPLLGQDYVQGDGGRDRLIIDYAALDAALVNTSVTLAAGLLSGFVQTALLANSVRFSDISVLDLALGSGGDLIRFNDLAAGSGVLLRVDGGGGEDVAVVSATGAAPLRLVTGADGSVTSNTGLRLTQFERLSVTAGAGNHTIRTGSGNDSVSVGLGASRIATGDGLDSISTSGGASYIYGGAGSDDIWRLTVAASGPAVKLLRDGATGKTLAGANGKAVGVEWFRGKLGDGDDRIRLIDDHNTIIDTGGGNDQIYLRNADGVDLTAGAGYDILRLDWSSRTAPIKAALSAGPAGDIYGSIALDRDAAVGVWFTFNYAADFRGFERVQGTLSAGADTLVVRLDGLAAGNVMNISGGAGDDHLIIAYADAQGVVLSVTGDELRTGTARFTSFEIIELFGSFGRQNDRLTGGNGADILHGGAGTDVLTGNGGADRFVFDQAGTGGDLTVLRDFTPGTDKIVLNRDYYDALNGIAPGAALPLAAFHAGTAAETADHRLIYNAATGELFYDADGTGADAQSLIARLTAGTVLTADDFVLS